MTTAKTKAVAETALFDQFDHLMNQKAYSDIERSQPALAALLQQLVSQGVEPVAIRSRMVQRYPNRWAEGQLLQQAATYLVNDRGES